ncbi:unnamed protein product [Caenorhabditis auriculariae]|uniref:Glutamate-rich WD repeat-containing protein 1 n=1 Tax=Caenorhabditis auriculariae TaxID=2777116 RepID=A0A8S1GW61_9PELO|nr:unnamed protein product [Caenorhabditis auriculariae]
MSPLNDDVEMEGEHVEDVESEDEDDEDEVEVLDSEKKVYIPGVSRALKEGEQLEFDPSAYIMFHSFNTDWPCLSFDIVRDGLGDNRSSYPAECYLVSGTQAERAKDNEIIVMGLKNMSSFKQKNDDSDSDESSDEEEEENETKQPVMHAVSISTNGAINRIKADRLGDSTVCAVWNDQGRVQLWNITSALNSANQMTGKSQTSELKQEKPLFTFAGSRKEGFALAWSPTKKGDLASGDIVRNIYMWQMQEGGQWVVAGKPLLGHKKSVEDLCWSPTEVNLMSSCSADGTIKLWDTRAAPAEACVATVENAHDADVNVLSWNQHDSLLVSGGDDAELKIWSLKTIQYGQSVARFKYHRGPITSVEWHPQETTTFMASGEDDQTSVWDIATEPDGDAAVEGIPPQLMFLHLGQHEVKEVHWHPQFPGLAVNTSVDGFNIFKTINI